MTVRDWADLSDVPQPGAAGLMAETASALLRRNGTDPAFADQPAVLFEDVRWTHADLFREARRWAAWFNRYRPADPAAPFHVGVLLDNLPEYIAAFAGAAWSGATLVGLNNTRRGEELARDISHTDLCVIVTEPEHADALPAAGLPPVAVLPDVDLPDQPPADRDPADDPPVSTTWCLIFTSGTSSAPKAVICSQRRLLVTGERMRTILKLERDDVGYLCMPMFHSNSLMVGLLPALLAGAAVGLRRRFSASGWLPDVRRYGVTYWNYTGKPLAYLLATPEQPDDADNPLQRAYGNEGSDAIVRRFGERFGVHVIDAFGPTEGGVGIVRSDTDPPGSLGHGGEAVRVVDEAGEQRPPAQFDENGRLLNPDDCVGEIVNVLGVGSFEGYYNNPEATERATRNGWYWSGDLGYADTGGYLYFAGRNSDWLRVDGENFPAGPIQSVLARYPGVVDVAVYGVPDAQAGDQVMAALVLRDGFDPAGFAEWVDAQRDLAPKWRPRYVRIGASLPRTATNKVLVRVLQREKFRLDLVGDDRLWVRGRGEPSYQAFGASEAAALRAEFAANDRDRFWDL
ncbi:MAG TPA: AMP-binding protein [Mycobacteriales bacterium]|nr:AMP-binding protein [Mycobacteriales bacterium]